MKLAATKRSFFRALVFIGAAVFFPPLELFAQDTDTPAQDAATAMRNNDFGQAIDDYTQIIQGNPQDATAYFQRAFAYVKASEDEKAIADLTQAIQIRPDYTQAYYRRSFIYMIEGKYDLATADLSQAIQINPQFAQAYHRRACVEMLTGKDDLAIADLDRVIQIDPTFSQAYVRRSYALMLKGDYARALQAMNEILLANPKASGTYNRMAWLRATCPDASFRDGKKAVESGTTACQLTEWRRSPQIDTLAAAYAEAGDFANAVKCEKLALAATSDPETSDAQKSRLALYEANKTYHVDKYIPHFEATIN